MPEGSDDNFFLGVAFRRFFPYFLIVSGSRLPLDRDRTSLERVLCPFPPFLAERWEKGGNSCTQPPATTIANSRPTLPLLQPDQLQNPYHGESLWSFWEVGLQILVSGFRCLRSPVLYQVLPQLCPLRGLWLACHDRENSPRRGQLDSNAGKCFLLGMRLSAVLTERISLGSGSVRATAPRSATGVYVWNLRMWQAVFVLPLDAPRPCRIPSPLPTCSPTSLVH